MELLVCIAIVAVLVSLLLPALGHVRFAAQRSVSLGNLRQSATLMAAYAGQYRDEFINPFQPGPSCGRTWASAWVWEPNDECERGWNYAPGGSELFGVHWLAHALYAEDRTLSRIDSLVAPGDRALLTWLRETNTAADGNISWIFPSSYWYPPVFWQRWDRFLAPTRPEGNSTLNWYYFRRNRTSDVTFPSRKVLVFESKEYASTLQAQFNLPEARPLVALVDGSAMPLRTADIIADTAAPGEESNAKLDCPSGSWDFAEVIGNRLYQYGPREGFSWVHGEPAYFWATRHGLRGRDFIR